MSVGHFLARNLPASVEYDNSDGEEKGKKGARHHDPQKDGIVLDEKYTVWLELGLIQRIQV